jgi:hypothetical protein
VVNAKFSSIPIWAALVCPGAVISFSGDLQLLGTRIAARRGDVRIAFQLGDACGRHADNGSRATFETVLAFAQGDEAGALEHSQMEGDAAAIVEAKIAIGHP